VDVAVVSTPNNLLCPKACEALKSGKDVLIEKPMGRNLLEAKKMKQVSEKSARVLKIGFNHRYHPAISKAHSAVQFGKIGKILNFRAFYGHGGREGYEKEWRGNYKIAGGGELTDQGVHLIDLIQWFCGEPSHASCFLQTAYWKIKPSEDNGFTLLKFKSGICGSFHSSWTEWKNDFSFTLFGENGFIKINGLGGSYGAETFTLGLKIEKGKVPEIMEEKFEGEDCSWKEEWDDFLNGVQNPKHKFLGCAAEGLAVMKTLDALYRSHQSQKTVRL